MVVKSGRRKRAGDDVATPVFLEPSSLVTILEYKYRSIRMKNELIHLVLYLDKKVSIHETSSRV